MLNAREALPHGGKRQDYHCDADSEYSDGKPDYQGFYSCTAVWLLDDFTRDNGATRIVPGTHRSSVLPSEVMPDVFAPHLGEVTVTGRAGDVCIMNGHVWHCGGRNTSAHSRRAILAHYVRRDVPYHGDHRRQRLKTDTRTVLLPWELALLEV